MSEYTPQGQQFGASQQGGPSQPQSGPFQQMPQAEQGHPRDQVPEYQPPRHEDYDTVAANPRSNPSRESSGMLSREEVERIIADRLAERDEEHAAEVARLQAQVPQLVVPAHGGGPGNDNHQRSWNLAEQEAARRGDQLEHWDV